MSSSRLVTFAWAVQRGLGANPVPLRAALGGAEPSVTQVGTEASSLDLKPEGQKKQPASDGKREKNHTDDSPRRTKNNQK